MSFKTLNLKTDYEKIAHLFSTFFKKEPTWAAVAETDLAFLAPAINTIVSMTEGAQADAAVMMVLVSIKKDVVLATKFIQAYDNSQNLTDVLNSLISNLQGFVTLPAIASHPQFSDISAYVNGVLGEVQMIQGSMPTTPITPKV